MKAAHIIVIAIVAVFLGVAVIWLSRGDDSPAPPVLRSEMPVAADVPAETPESTAVPPMGMVSDVIDTPSSDQVSVMPLAGESPLLGKKWMLVWLDNTEIAQDGRAPYLTLEATDGRASGMGGCNRFSGPYKLEGEALSFPEGFMATKMACERLDTEGAFFRTLERVVRWHVSVDTLTLSDNEGTEIARFKDVASTAP